MYRIAKFLNKAKKKKETPNEIFNKLKEKPKGKINNFC